MSLSAFITLKKKKNLEQWHNLSSRDCSKRIGITIVTRVHRQGARGFHLRVLLWASTKIPIRFPVTSHLAHSACRVGVRRPLKRSRVGGRQVHAR